MLSCLPIAILTVSQVKETALCLYRVHEELDGDHGGPFHGIGEVISKNENV